MATLNMSAEDEIIIDNFWTINTFIFLDLETTGLIKEHTPLPKITELAMVAVSRDNFVNCENGLPRVLHKLVLPINPGIEISTFIENMTKLTSDSLKNDKGFNQNVLETLKCFLERLKKPICLVSHNGYRFDFPLLFNEMKLIKQDFVKDLPENLLCLDSLVAFKELLKPPSQRPSPVQRHSSDHTYSSPNNNIIAREIISSRRGLDNFKLPTIYKHLCGRQVESPQQLHSAECDCLMLLKCCLKVKQQFVIYGDMNADRFVDHQLSPEILRSCY